MTALEQVPAVLYFFVPAHVANMSPVLVQRWFVSLAVPIDGGRTFRGRRILGDHETWRGLLAGIAVGPLVLARQVLAHRAGYLRLRSARLRRRLRLRRAAVHAAAADDAGLRAGGVRRQHRRDRAGGLAGHEGELVVSRVRRPRAARQEG